MVRQRSRPGQGPSKAKRSLCRKDSSGSISENPIGKDEGLCTNNISTHLHHSTLCSLLLPCFSICFYLFYLICFHLVVLFDLVSGWTEALPDTPVDEMPPGPEVPEKIKKRYRKKKTKLEEAFPTYLQV